MSHAINPIDLRPLSLLPVPGKLLEKYVAGRITFFLEGKNYFTEKQFGFRNCRSTSGALSTILDNIVYQLNNAEFSVVAYLDFQKAFDTINHKIIIKKLENAGLGQNSLKLLQNYLSNRKQKNKNTFRDLINKINYCGGSSGLDDQTTDVYSVY